MYEFQYVFYAIALAFGFLNAMPPRLILHHFKAVWSKSMRRFQPADVLASPRASSEPENP